MGSTSDVTHNFLFFIEMTNPRSASPAALNELQIIPDNIQQKLKTKLVSNLPDPFYQKSLIVKLLVSYPQGN